MIRKHVIVQGHVQGVGFRYYTRGKAERWGLTGYVHNLPDGSVEVEIEGEQAAVARMLAWLQTGPSSAVVAQTRVKDVPVTGESRFSVIH
ncbi:hypothetical protein GY21_04500 [Cryobacterium roopkundense]|uniref:acylphosphatase n=1 Tax=Cryobacterium roopkundense TaxID=1001240 RepID=A0A099JNB4_9MICO|nr:acylphosphatase [Cryobacterium roopkundense]KGJ79605.1 hypothetical protein GY21_04500 [Cryobacterium roopkundense]MBB5639827.1 acylphosphatase [Cryobacterium roopkundense]